MRESGSQFDLYRQVVAIVADYIGPAADRFVDRHIQNHLGKSPDQLKRSDLTVLIDWLRISMAFLTQDRKIVDELVQRLTKLENPKSQR